MFGTGGKLLSGIPIHELGTVKREDVNKGTKNGTNAQSKIIEIMPFGKHKGERISEIPTDYKQWMLANFDWTPANESLRKSIVNSM